MATKDATVVGNILDVYLFKAPDGGAMEQPLNSLVEVDDFSRYVPALPSNGGLSHSFLRLTNLPTGYIVDIGGSWKSSKAGYERVTEGIMNLQSSYEAPIDTFENEPEEVGNQLLEAELDAHIHTLSQAMNNVLINGHTAPNISAIVGLKQREPYTTYDNSFCFSLGGSGDNLRSAWLIKPGIDTVFKLYNGNHPVMGVEQKDMGPSRIDGLGTGTDEHNWIFTVENKLQGGIGIRDMRAVKRLCNIPVDPTAYVGEDVCNMAIHASIVNATKKPGRTNGLGTASVAMNTWLLLCDEQLYSKLVRGVNDRIQVKRSEDNPFQTALPMIGTNIIIARMDALNCTLGSGETAVSAAS